MKKTENKKTGGGCFQVVKEFILWVLISLGFLLA
jgi:hypothetical protein